MSLTRNLRIRRLHSSEVRPPTIPCSFPGCRRSFINNSGLTHHIRKQHSHLRHHSSASPISPPSSPPVVSPVRQRVGSYSSRPCDENGNFLPPNTPPSPRRPHTDPEDWTPYESRLQFETAEFLFTRNQMSAGHIDTASQPLGCLYDTIDSTPLGDVPWEAFNLKYGDTLPENEVPAWMTSEYVVWFRDPHFVIRNVLSNPDFEGEFDYAPYQEYDVSENHRFQDFMSGNWAWKQADEIAKDPNTHGSMFVPIILGSDKTTVSVGTGHTEYYPIYSSIGNIHNNVRRAHWNGVVLLGFLAIPKTDKRYSDDVSFRKFRRQLFHKSLATILESLKAGMTTPEVMRCPDGHFRRVIFGLGPYIADYPEQVLLACIVQGWCPKCTARPDDLDGESTRRTRQHSDVIVEELELGVLWHEYRLVGDIVPFTNDFPRADIHELLTPDLLHQVIKGTFKDHLVTWVQDYLIATHGARHAKEVMDDIDHRIAVVAPFSGLRRFPKGRGFKQWTGDDSKALMKVYLPAIEGHVPHEMVRAFRAFLEFCYIARSNVHDTTTFRAMAEALKRFHEHRKIFQECGVRPDGFSLPRQHSLVHYESSIRAFGAPNGICSSITESKHIKAVKEPWRWSNRFNPLGQMLVTNQRLDKLAASRVDFKDRGMLDGTIISNKLCVLQPANDPHDPHDVALRTGGDHNDDDKQDEGEGEGVLLVFVCLLANTVNPVARRCSAYALAAELGQPDFVMLIRQFLHGQLHPDSEAQSLISVDDTLNALPDFHNSEKISVYNSASVTFYAPSDLSGIGGMRRERPSRYDCVFVVTDDTAEGMRSLDVARVQLLFSFTYADTYYPCALVHWFLRVGDNPDEDTGLWMVEPDRDAADGSPHAAVIHLDTVFRAAHLIGVYGSDFLPKDLSFTDSLDAFRLFYVNKFIDNHAFLTAY
ncbi:hypothetical protein F5888DRAFT_1796370 [Russula emetica]|nr:hypothetical protein F5888DRAFT_1796370 [Russula emetica]